MARDLEAIVREMIIAIGDDPEREGLADTPRRVVKAWSHLFSGYGDPPKGIERSFSANGLSEMIILRNIPFYSTCEHHLLPFFGRATVAYIPGLSIAGASKLARIVEWRSRRLQIQERLTDEIADYIEKYFEPVGVGVRVEAQHLCMTARGIEKATAEMLTHALRGAILKDGTARAEFFAACGG